MGSLKCELARVKECMETESWNCFVNRNLSVEVAQTSDETTEAFWY
jgi:hypothetical protein